MLVGPRQCGKTTTSLSFPGNVYRSLDNIEMRDAALNDPHVFVKHENQLMIIDEVQRVPSVLLAVKIAVDKNQAYGRFLLTGSVDIQEVSGVTESLAGRMWKVRLRPLAVGEIERKKPRFIPLAFSGALQKLQFLDATNYDTDACLALAFEGGYPEPLRLSTPQSKREWHMNYLQALVDQDLRDIINIRRRDNMFKLIEVLAAWSSKFMDFSGIGKSLALARPTIENYINALEALYLIERVHPWYKTDYDRIGKQDKLFLTDTGLMTSILNWRFDDVRLAGKLNSKLMETFVFNQLAAQLDAQESSYELYHYRDRSQHEVDFIIEHEDRSILAIEVKAGSAVNASSFKHIRWFKEHIAKDRRVTGIVLYTGKHVLSFGNNQWAVPICSLWS